MKVKHIVENFLINEKDKINCTSLAFKAIESCHNNLKYDELVLEIKKGVNAALIEISDCNHREIVYKAYHEIEFGYESVITLINLNVVKLEEEKSNDCEETNNFIKKNLEELKKKLAAPLSDTHTELCDELLDLLCNFDESTINWDNTLANQILDEKSEIINNLSGNSLIQFLEPKNRFQTVLPEEFKSKIIRFINEFKKKNDEMLCKKRFFHNSKWVEGNIRLKKIVDDILLVIKGIWNNKIYSNNDLIKKINEGTYFSDIVNQLLRTAFSGLINGDNIYYTVAEMQSSASQLRKLANKDNLNNIIGHKPDAMLSVMINEKKYELVYVECAKITNNLKKKKDVDYMKLFRFCNDSLDLVLNSCTPPNNEFGILGIQIYESFIFSYHLIIDSNNVKRYYHLEKAEIPISYTDEFDKVIYLINFLLNLRNLVTINISILTNTILHSDKARKKKNIISSTIETPPPKKEKR